MSQQNRNEHRRQDNVIVSSKRGKDINLSDESAGKEVGRLLPGERSKDALKQSYRNKIKKSGASEQQKRQSDIIFGGDEDDPRWDEHNRRVQAARKKASR